jgi:hypothetical protein
VNGRIFFPNVIDTLLSQLDLNRYEINAETGEKVMMPEYAMFATSRDDMPFWLFSKITADRAKVKDFHLIVNDLREYFANNVDEENHGREWNASFVNFIPSTTKEVVIFNTFSNAINHIWIEN